MGSTGAVHHAYVADSATLVVQELPAEAFNSGSTVAISPDGETAVVGSLYGGAVSVLVDDPVSGWVQRWHLEGQLEDEGDGYFGAAVAVTDAGTVVVGAPRARAVSVFDRRGAALVRTARFTPPYATQGNDLGGSVAVSADGSTVVAGARYRSIASRSITGAGAGYRWVRSPGGWSWAGLLSVADPQEGDYQGWSTAMSGDGRVVVLGAPYRQSAQGRMTGAAIVFSAVH